MRPAEPFERILAVFDWMEIAYLIGGSMASSVHGIARPTMDVNLVADIRPEHVDEFAKQMQSDFYCDADAIRDALARKRPFNLIHFATTFKFDIFPALDDEFNRSQLTRRAYGETRSFGEPIECKIASAEDTILSKLRWYRATGETSERHWNDLRGILQVSGRVLDLEYLRKWAPKLEVADLWERLLAER